MSDSYQPEPGGLLERLFGGQKPRTDPVADLLKIFQGTGDAISAAKAPSWLQTLGGGARNALNTLFIPGYGIRDALNKTTPEPTLVPPVDSGTGLPPTRPIIPRSITSGATPSVGTQVGSWPAQTLPAPPTLDMPPNRAPNPNIDFSRVEGWLDKSAPSPSGHLASVLGGLSQTGPERSFAVAPTFSEVLASMGAGASKGYAASAAQHADYARHRAGVTMDQTKLTAENERENTRIAYENAQRTYDANIKNKLMEYEHRMQEAGLQKPSITGAPNGVIIRQTDPATGRETATFHTTREPISQAEKITDIYKVLTGAPAGPGPELMQAQTLSSMYKDNPVLGRAAMMQLAVAQAVNRGTGKAVFGNVYDQAVETAKRELQQFNPGLLAKPEEYSRQMYQRVSAILQAHPQIMEGSWLERATRQNIGAAMILRSGQETTFGLDEQGQPAQPAPPRTTQPE